jgi:hypothetical protein
MKYTLLELVQSIASTTDSDEINSISDSVESMQIANVVRTAYFDLIQRANLPEHHSLVSLDASGDNEKPTLMTVPSTVAEIKWIKYDCQEDGDTQPNMRLVDYLPLEEFLHRMHSYDQDETEVGTFEHTIGVDTFTFVYKNDRHPVVYTTFDDNTVIFDSYDADVDTTLQKSKTMCFGRTVIPFTLSDSFTPDLDEGQFALLLNEAKSLAWLELKQSPHLIAERNSKRGWSNIQNKKDTIDKLSDFERLPNFGRRSFGRGPKGLVM